MNEVESISDPLVFSHTGFTSNLKYRTLDVNLESTLGLQRPFPDKMPNAIYR